METKVPLPIFEYKWNLTTVVAIISLIGAFWTVTNYISKQDSRDQNQDLWIAEHEKETEQRREQRIRTDGETSIRFQGLEKSDQEFKGQVERMGDRITAAEKGLETMGDRFDRLSSAIGDIRDTGADLKTELEVVKTIVTNIEKQGKSPASGR